MDSASDSTLIIIGNVAHCTTEGQLKVFSGFVAVAKGKIIACGQSKCISDISRDLYITKYVVKELLPNQLLIPGFVDCHLHAPQFPNLGMGLDKPLMEWLDAYTFPLEKQYESTQFATKIYSTVVSRTLRCGTTTACYFASLHLDSSIVLANAAATIGQRALVGKVSMNIPNDAQYFNDSEKELRETEIFLQTIINMKNDTIEPIITPRFALSTDEQMMKNLAKLAKKYDCRIQSHISENLGEIAAVKEHYPNQTTYAEVYDNAGLLTDKCIMAHGVHLEETECQLLAARGVSIAHCPASNTRLISGLCPIKVIQQRGIKVGLGTDVSGGDSPSIMDAMRRCMDVSTHLSILDSTKHGSPVSWSEAFYLATLAGAKALSLEHKIGNFSVGKDFDALIVDLYTEGSPIDKYPATPIHSSMNEEDKIKNTLQLFVYMGDNRNIIGVYVKGREIKF